jgi:hypothetical protein
MRYLFSFMVVAMASAAALAQSTAIDSVTHQVILVGPVERSAFDTTSWYRSNRDLYKPTTGLVHRIDSLDTGDSVAVVFGSWCSDSHMWVPIFLSVTDSTTLAHKIGFIAVPRSREGRDKLTPGLGIDKVPTFIFYRSGKEIGRIVEEPMGDIGESIVNILKGGK